MTSPLIRFIFMNAIDSVIRQINPVGTLKTLQNEKKRLKFHLWLIIDDPITPSISIS